jgi:hypothetical protein
MGRTGEEALIRAGSGDRLGEGSVADAGRGADGTRTTELRL